MKSILSKKWIGTAIQRKNTTPSVHVHQYFVFTDIELFSLVICIILDVIEYAAVVLTMPLIGDVFDAFGILACVLMFRWIGLISFVELLPGADVLPVFIITWLIWYFIKKEQGSRRKVKLSLK